ncbi:hypothetical protein FISHEDRAFT_75534 [Fistulina hepatica ATCC 64428]|uniref:Complex 1 LYR protein domain-containing protein n=1 Tax=Fistulina hepatica ATCC 64428 TaxID=1128425 RepID=A0A0D7A6S7_9AGAR|nr:hypothetical protein FISHEDRAFT_75534 [Fistulina hepatica ATCC 64428]
MTQLSGLQKDVLALYRRALRMARTKPVSAQPKFTLFVRYTFRTTSSSVSARDLTAIEHLLRKGKRQLAVYEDPAVKDCWVSKEMYDWQKAHYQRTH